MRFELFINLILITITSNRINFVVIKECFRIFNGRFKGLSSLHIRLFPSISTTIIIIIRNTGIYIIKTTFFLIITCITYKNRPFQVFDRFENQLTVKRTRRLLLIILLLVQTSNLIFIFCIILIISTILIINRIRWI